ncbi:sure-like protein [Gautieria morchelliformis]|nr:sure-like protein [Gautieria morchelliformis]
MVPVLLAVLAVVLTNDDGWATASIRAQHALLTASGFRSILCAPADNQSGSGSLDYPPTARTERCQWNSCLPGASLGYNHSDPMLNYVNSYPVTAVNYALDTLAPKLLHAPPHVVISGPNIGTNIGMSIFVSGTIGAAAAAAKAGVPALAVSASSGEHLPYTALRPDDVFALHARLSLRILTALTGPAPPPFLPPNTLLNINYPPTTPPCLAPGAFTFVLTRAFSIPFTNSPHTCGRDTLPLEGDVLANPGSCEISVSVLDAQTKLDAGYDVQAAVLQRLEVFLGCSSA